MSRQPSDFGLVLNGKITRDDLIDRLQFWESCESLAGSYQSCLVRNAIDKLYTRRAFTLESIHAYAFLNALYTLTPGGFKSSVGLVYDLYHFGDEFPGVNTRGLRVDFQPPRLLLKSGVYLRRMIGAGGQNIKAIRSGLQWKNVRVDLQ